MFAVLLTAALPARGAEPVAVRAGLHPGFGRVVLEWPAPVEVEGRQEQDRYRLRFGRPLEAVLAPALARLRDYLENARLSADARQLTLELAPGIAVRQRVEAERIVVLDLAPTLVPERVAVRTGLHDGFARIVFHWPAPTAFDAVTTERRIAIRFDRAGHIDVTRPAARLAAWLAGAEASRSNGQSEVRLEMRPGVSAHVFRVDDERLAVDLRAAPARPAANGAGAASAAAAPAEARPSTVRMRDVLIEALRAEADLGPVQAYALFRNFEQLLAHDGLGDDVRRGLARRLAEIDLIRPAAALPPALDQRRRILGADALARLERRSAALALLDGLHTPAADRLRIGILWQEEDWPAVASALEHALARREARQPLTDDEQAMVLQLAVAHGRLGQGAALARLRARFAAALRGLPIEPAFLMATAAPALAGDPEAVLAAAERHLREVRGYLRAEQASN